MTASFTADAIVFAINSAIKLGRNTQRAYAKSIKAKAIVLPLPKFAGTPNVHKAHEFFSDKNEKTGGHQFVRRIESLKLLFKKFDLHGLKPAEGKDYIEYYLYFKEMLRREVEEGLDDIYINTDELVALLRIRQWEQGKMPKTSPLQYVAGTLVEIGIDYFNQVPGALNTNSAFGKSMRSFLSAIDDVPFSDSDQFKAAAELIVPKLFITAAEITGQLSMEISKDEKIQAFITTTCRHISSDIFKRVQDHQAGDQEAAVQWGQLVLHSMVKNAGTYVFHSSADLMKTNSGVSRLIEETGGVLLDFILQDPDKINLKAGFNVDALNRVVQASLSVVAEHPELVVRREGLRGIISGVSRSLAESKLTRPDLLPELVRLIMQHTAGNLHVVWKTSPDGAKHLLVFTVKMLLESLSQPTLPDEHWLPRLGRLQLMAMADTLLEEVVTNPAWIRTRVNDKPVLREMLDATFAALGALPQEDRISFGTLDMLLKLNIRTVAICPPLLDRLKLGDGTTEKTYLNKTLDLVFTFVFKNEQVPGPARITMLTDLMEYSLGMVMARHPNAQGLQLLDLILFKHPEVDFTQGFDRVFANELIDAALEVMHEHPQLVSRQVSLQPIISGVLGALNASAFKQPGMLPELVRLILANSALHTDLIMGAAVGEPKYLLSIAVRQLLEAISFKSADGQWQPKLTGQQALDMTEAVFNEIVDHPEVVMPMTDQPTIFESVMQGVFSALQQIPANGRFSTDHLEWVVRHSLRNAATNEQLLSKVKWGSGDSEVVLFHKMLELTFSYAFPAEEEGDMMPQDQFEDLLGFVMQRLMLTHPDKQGLVLADLILFDDHQLKVKRYFQPSAAEELIDLTLRVFSVRPELVTKDRILHKLFRDTASALQASKLEKPEMLPELFRLVLANLADNNQLIMELRASGAKSILTDTTAQVLRAIAAKPSRGTWKPTLGTEEIVDVLDGILEEVIQNPKWMSDDEIILKTLDAVFISMEVIAAERHLPFVTVKTLVESTLQAVAFRRQLIQKPIQHPDRTQDVALTYALKQLFGLLYPAEDPTPGIWTLTQTTVVNNIISSFLHGLAEGPVNREKIDEKISRVREAADDLNNNLSFSLDHLLSELEQ